MKGQFSKHSNFKRTVYGNCRRNIGLKKKYILNKYNAKLTTIINI